MEYSSPQADLLKYLSGEISFEEWLENQQSSQFQPQAQSHQNVTPLSGNIDNAESSAMFSSWGMAFTGQTGSTNMEMSYPTVKENEDGEYMDDTAQSSTEHAWKDDASNVEESDMEDYEDEFYQPSVLSPGTSLNSDVVDLKLPSFANIAVLNTDDTQLQGTELTPIIEKLPNIISTSTVRQGVGRKKHENKEEVPDILKDFHNFQLRKRGVKKGDSIARNKLPELLRLQMGQANLLVAKGDFKKAADICMEIVREAPYSGLPFKTLAFIYEEQGDREMSLQYSLISAFLDCKDAQEWRELAKRCLDAGNKKQASACFDRACKVKPDDISLQWERASMYFESQDYKKALDIYQVIVKMLCPTDVKEYMDIAKIIAKLYHKYGFTDKAGDTLEAAFSSCPQINDFEGINILSEIFIGAKKFQKVIKLISSHCHVKLPCKFGKPSKDNLQKTEKQSLENLNNFINKALMEDFKDITSTMATEIAVSAANTVQNPASSISKLCSGTATDSQKEYTTLRPVQKQSDVGDPDDYQVPGDLPLDIRIKLAQCLIYCNELSCIEGIIKPLLSEDINEVGDLVLDVAEAYFETGKYQEALKYLQELVESEKYNQAAVWLKIAESFENINEVEDSIHAYYQVLLLAPLQVSVRLKLANSLRTVGRDEEAITVLAEYESACVDDEEREEQPRLSEENRLKIEEYEEWYRKCLQMYTDGRLREFIYHSYILMHNYLMSTYTYQKKQTVGKAHIWELMRKILNVSVELKEYQKAINLLDRALLFKPYAESKKYRLELDYLQTTLYFVAGDYSKAFDSFRVLLTHENDKHIHANAVWNLFTQIVNKMLDKRHHRYTLRFLFKKPKLIPLIIQNGNNSHMSGTYKYAIGEFSRAFREWPTYPLNSLLLGVSFLHLSCQKFHKTRHTSILHGLIFMYQYFYLREGNQEAYYNVARAFHQIGLVHFAVYYYNKALEFPLHDERNSSLENINYHPFIDLHREAAYNLSLIYKASGNVDLARKTLYKYCWV